MHLNKFPEQCYKKNCAQNKCKKEKCVYYKKLLKWFDIKAPNKNAP